MKGMNTSISLLQRAQEGDNQAWIRIMNLYSPLVTFWCNDRGIGAKDIEEITASVMSTLVQRLPKFDHNGREGAFRAWLRKVTQSEISNHFRVLSKPAEGGTSAQRRFSEVTEPKPVKLSDELSVLYQQAWSLVKSEFSQRDSEIFHKVVELEVAPKEVAEQMELPPHVVYKVVSRVKHRLRVELEIVVGENDAN